MATTITGTTIDVGTNVIVTDAAGKVGVGTASPANYYADELVVTAADEGGMTLVTGTGHANYIAFADGTSGNAAYRGFVKYDHANDKMTLGTAGSSAIEVNVVGEVTMPLQPAFQATATSTQSNKTVNQQHTILFAGETFDNNNNFSSNTFTAPVTGKYYLTTNVRLDNLDISASYYQLWMVTSNRDYVTILGMNGFDADITLYTLTLNVLADMDAGDTAVINFNQASGAAQTDIDGDGKYTNFSGYLVC